MSSIVSRSPPAWGSVSHSKDLRWMSIRLGTSRLFSRRAKLRRVRGASTRGKAATPRGVVYGQDEARSAPRARPANLAQANTAPREGAVNTHGPRPQLPRMWRGAGRGGRLRLLVDVRRVAPSRPLHQTRARQGRVLCGLATRATAHVGYAGARPRTSVTSRRVTDR